MSVFALRLSQVSHVCSHHPFPNSINDFEITAFEPFIHFAMHSAPKSTLYRISVPLYMHLLFALGGVLQFLQRVVHAISFLALKLFPSHRTADDAGRRVNAYLATF